MKRECLIATEMTRYEREAARLTGMVIAAACRFANTEGANEDARQTLLAATKEYQKFTSRPDPRGARL